MQTLFTTIRDKATSALRSVGVWLFSQALRRRRKFYSSVIVLSDVYCFLEIWQEITRGKPIDQTWALYDKINNAIDFCLSESFNSHTDIPIFEREILGYQYDKRILHVENKDSSYWKSKFSLDQLPQPLRRRRRPRYIRSYLEKQINKIKRDIASINYFKIDFSTSDLTAIVALSSTILLLLGYSRVATLHWWFGIPYQRYYSISDYIARSVNSISQYLFAAFFVVILSVLYSATITAYSLQAASASARTLDGRVRSLLLHFVGISSIVALVIVFIQQSKIDALSFQVAMFYLGAPIIAYVSNNFFVTPYKAFAFISIFFFSFVSGLSGVILEIERVLAPNAGPSLRVLKFPDAEYPEPEWAVLDITSDFVILRRRQDGTIQVRSKSDLKRIDNSPVDAFVEE
jgi:hypothetical protein